MSWFSSLLGGFTSGYGYSDLGSSIAGMGAGGYAMKNPITGAMSMSSPSGWYNVGQTLGQISARGGGGVGQPGAGSISVPSVPTPSQPQRRTLGQSMFNIPTPSSGRRKTSVPPLDFGGYGEGFSLFS